LVEEVLVQLGGPAVLEVILQLGVIMWFNACGGTLQILIARRVARAFVQPVLCDKASGADGSPYYERGPQHSCKISSHVQKEND
jgi:hypothetical protein